MSRGSHCAHQVEAPLETAGSKFPAIPERAQRESSNKKGVRRQLGERESTKVISFGWMGQAAARELGVQGVEFCPTVIWPVISVWMLEPMVIDLKLLETKAHRKGVDLVTEFYAYGEIEYKKYVHIYTGGSKDVETGSTRAAVVVPSRRGEMYVMLISMRT